MNVSIRSLPPDLWKPHRRGGWGYCRSHRRWRIAEEYGPLNQLNRARIGSETEEASIEACVCLHQVLCICAMADNLVFCGTPDSVSDSCLPFESFSSYWTVLSSLNMMSFALSYSLRGLFFHGGKWSGSRSVGEWRWGDERSGWKANCDQDVLYEIKIHLQ